MKILGLDVGEKRIGVAKVDSKVKIAVPVGFIAVDGSEWQEIARIARLNSTNSFVLGLPRSNEGNETAQSQYVRKFASELKKHVPEAKISFQDESLTSVLAEERLKSRKKAYQRGDIDAEAATIILQDFIERFSDGASSEASSEASDLAFSETLRSRPSLRGSLALVAPVVATGSSKDKSRSRKKLVLTCSLLIVLVLGGVTGALKYRDYVRWQREEYYKEQESQMKAEVFTFTVAPGETIFDLKKDLATIKRGEGVENYTQAEIEAAFNAEYNFDFLKERPTGASLEGYLYPETYEFYATDTVETVLAKFLGGMEKVIAENNLRERFNARGLSLHEGITLASIVQAESVANSNDQAIVAQVFYSRIAYGWKLGSDSTITYALDVLDPERNIYKDNAAALTIDSCYNTRIYAGLPCGPIANSGLSALIATAEPADTAYLFFLTGDDGLMYYSYTEAEHFQNTHLHCQTLCNILL